MDRIATRMKRIGQKDADFYFINSLSLRLRVSALENTHATD